MTIRLALDVSSLHTPAWTPLERLEYCATQGVQVVQCGEVPQPAGLGAAHLTSVGPAAPWRAHADSGLALAGCVLARLARSRSLDSGGSAGPTLHEGVP